MKPLYVQTIDDDTQLQGPNGEMEPLDVQTIDGDTQLQGLNDEIKIIVRSDCSVSASR